MDGGNDVDLRDVADNPVSRVAKLRPASLATCHEDLGFRV